MNDQAGPFSDAQKEYLEGYAAGLRLRELLPFVGERGDGRITSTPGDGAANLAAPLDGEETAFGIPIDELTREERFKLEENPLDIWDKILRHAAAGTPPEGGDVFRFKFHGLFYVAPTQDSLMLRVRVPANEIAARQMRALAGIAKRWGNGQAHVTTRGNIQIREIAPGDIVNVLMALSDAGLTSRGAGADNVRNITATPTSGLDPAELYDVRPLAKGLQFYLSNNRDLFGLPRKFNVAFDTGGSVSVVSDTNDIGFQAVRIDEAKGAARGFAAGVCFRVLLGGITGHGFFAEDAGIVVPPEECVAVAAAMIRVFAALGDRTDRKKARLRHLIDRVGLDAYLAAVEDKLAFPLRRLPPDMGSRPRAVIRHGHVGAYTQKQPGLSYVGVAVPVGRLTVAQMSKLAELAEERGSGALRLTVWQNVILPDIEDGDLGAVRRRVKAMGLDTSASAASAGLVACTGNTGCKFALSDTKRHALEIRRALDRAVTLDGPVNIHLTGCPNSCAQHYVGDIGLLGAQVAAGSETVEGYTVLLGGGFGREQALAREIASGVPADALPGALCRLLKTYLARRETGESFAAFAQRHEVGDLRAMLLDGVS